MLVTIATIIGMFILFDLALCITIVGVVYCARWIGDVRRFIAGRQISILN